mmetsp:Transcript_21758/g.85033  ORF Transcript_21758/g.85033 Transcript_21758/m.85033 type:complete len:202 (+) Transcript_21758:2258-2863(+)
MDSHACAPGETSRQSPAISTSFKPVATALRDRCASSPAAASGSASVSSTIRCVSSAASSSRHDHSGSGRAPTTPAQAATLSRIAPARPMPPERTRTTGRMRPSNCTPAAPASSSRIVARSTSLRSSSGTLQRKRTQAPSTGCATSAARSAPRSGLPPKQMSTVRRAGVVSRRHVAESGPTCQSRKPFSPASPWWNRPIEPA